MKHPIINTTREAFFNPDAWLTSKKGNLYLRDHNATYTVVKSLDENRELLRCVIVGPGGARRDVGPFESSQELQDALWPEGAEAPVGVES